MWVSTSVDTDPIGPTHRSVARLRAHRARTIDGKEVTDVAKVN